MTPQTRPLAKRFLTNAGIEVPAVTARMRELDRIATEETGPNLFQTMENAGRDLALLAIELLGDRWRERRVVVLAGTGDNGGGGICGARHLANRGVDVRLCLAEPDRLTQVTVFQRKVFGHTSGREVGQSALDDEPIDLIVDALLGYSLDSDPREPEAGLIRWANTSGAPILALDIPSGVDATTGEIPGDFVRPKWTMTLALPKTGLVPEKTGDLFLADIGIPEGVYRRMALPYTPPFEERCWIRLASPSRSVELK